MGEEQGVIVDARNDRYVVGRVGGRGLHFIYDAAVPRLDLVVSSRSLPHRIPDAGVAESVRRVVGGEAPPLCDVLIAGESVSYVAVRRDGPLVCCVYRHDDDSVLELLDAAHPDYSAADLAGARRTIIETAISGAYCARDVEVSVAGADEQCVVGYLPTFDFFYDITAGELGLYVSCEESADYVPDRRLERDLVKNLPRGISVLPVRAHHRGEDVYAPRTTAVGSPVRFVYHPKDDSSYTETDFHSVRSQIVRWLEAQRGN